MDLHPWLFGCFIFVFFTSFTPLSLFFSPFISKPNCFCVCFCCFTYFTQGVGLLLGCFSPQTPAYFFFQCFALLYINYYGWKFGGTYARLFLAEYEKKCLFTDVVHSESLDVLSSLIGKILAPQIISFDQINSLFKKLWNPKSSFSCRSLDDNVVLFSFGNLADKKKGSIRCPMAFRSIFDAYAICHHWNDCIQFSSHKMCFLDPIAWPSP